MNALLSIYLRTAGFIRGAGQSQAINALLSIELQESYVEPGRPVNIW